MARKKNRTIGEEIDSKERKVEKSRRSKHTTWAHGDDTWNVMYARQTCDLSHACAYHQMWINEKMWRVRCAVHTHRRLQQIAVSCKRSDYNKKKSCKVSLLSSFVNKPHNGSLRSMMLLISRAQRCSTLMNFMSSTRNCSTATMMCWMKTTTHAIFDTARKESVPVALLQTHGEDGAILLMLRWSLIGVFIGALRPDVLRERSTNAFCI